MFNYILTSLPTIQDGKKYSMHIFGFVAFTFTLSLGLLAFSKYINTCNENLAIYLLYGVFLFILNLFYLKAIRLSREDYEEQLKQEKEYSQSLLKSQKNFLRYVVHETNTPLAVIMANIELYEMEEGKHPALLNIEAATKNIFGIYDDLSYLTRKDKVSYPKQFIILSDFIQTRINFFTVLADQLGLRFELQDNSYDAVLYFNETKLQRIIDNNITNAIKYTHDNEIIYISILNTIDKVTFKISSHSDIIENTEHIFDAYFRENLKEEGLGLGLKLVHTICVEENVDISLDSSVDITSFSYSFAKGIL